MYYDYDNSILMYNDFIYGEAILKSNLTVKNANEFFYEFLGSNSKLFFNQLIHPDYVDEFFRALRSLQDKESCRLITMLQDCHNQYHTVDIHMIKKVPMAAEDITYALRIYEIGKIEDIYLDYMQKIDKYRVIMGMTDCLFFEYWSKDGGMVFYNYIAKKAHVLYSGSIEQWYHDVVRYAQQENKNLNAINIMYKKMSSLTNHFEISIRSGFLNESHLAETLHVQARYLNKYNEQLIVGVIHRADIKEQTLPYYMTMAGKDSVTGILNKKSIIEYSHDILSSSADKKHYMILIDIDDFKLINDTYGHQIGDKLIVLVSNILSETLGNRGIVGRFGGDEFYLLTDDIVEEDALRIFIKTVISSLRLSLAERMKSIPVTLSMGISSYPDNSRDYNELVSLADKALYIAKAKGKNRYIIYRPELHANTNVLEKLGERAYNISEYMEQSQAVRLAVKKLLTYGVEELKSILSMICSAFDLDGISIYLGKDYLKRVFSVGSFKDSPADASFMRDSGYSSLFDAQGMNILNSIDNIEKISEEVYALFSGKNYVSLIQMAIPDAKEPRCIISYDVLNRKHKWNDSEITYLNILGNVLYQVIQDK